MTEAFPIRQPATSEPAAGKYRPYAPLIALALISVVIAETLHASFNLSFMSLLMGFVLIQFAFVKLIDIETFAMRFAQYDVIAARLKFYGYLFPLIELALGLSYIGNYCPVITNWTMLVVGLISLIGILQILKSGQKIKCACMGSSAEMKLGTVTVIENALMVGMALSYIIGLQ